MRDRIRDILQRYWGYSEFRPLQEDIILSVLSGHDTLGLLPTGGGKSITFQVPAMFLDGLTVVITPLISLMKDQVDNLMQHGIKAVYIHAGLSRREYKLSIDKCTLGKSKLLYVSPEKLQSPRFIEQVRLMPVKLIVIDEAHCISQWGYDFRPSYLRIAELRHFFSEVPVLALTASATPSVVQDIKSKLEFADNSNTYAKSFARSNISYIVRLGENKPEKLLQVLKNVGGSAIVYVRSRRRTKEIAQFISEAGISASFYHAGLSIEDKEDKQQKWKTGNIRVIVATNAFGMGIDKPDVRVVIHVDLPSSLEEYYQEAGRAGRDGKASFAVILVSNRDKATLKRRVSDNFPDKDFIRRIYELACNFVEVPVGSGYNQVYDFNTALFCERFKLPPRQTHSALRLLSQAGYFEYVENVNIMAKVMMLASRNELYGFKGSEQADNVLQFLLRTYSGLFADYVTISESSMAFRLDMTEDDVYHALLELNREHILHYIPRRSNPYLFFVTSRELPKYIQIPISVYEDMRERMEQRISSVEQFAFDSSHCRANTILEYFGEQISGPCNTCDVCRSQRKVSANKTDLELLRNSILYLASKSGGTPLETIFAEVGRNRNTILEQIRYLLDNDLISIDQKQIITKK